MSKGDLAWNSMKGKGSTDETLRQSQLLAQGELTIKAVEGLKVDLKHIDQKTVSQTIDAMVEADPQLAWLKDAEARGDVDWRQVKEVHDSFKYSHSGLGVGAQLVIAVIVTYLTSGAASTALGTAAGATAGSGTAMAASGTASLSAIAGGATAGSTVAAGWANVALTAVASGAASTATISTINNRGNLGLVVKDVTSSDALRGYAVSGITAGLTTGVFDGWTNTTTNVEGALPNAGKVVAEGGLSSLEGIGRFGANQLLQNGTSTVLDKALGGDSQFDNALRSSLANTFAAAGFNWVGDVGKQFGLADGGAAKIGLHAVMGGLAAEASGGDFKSGALAAGLNEAVVDELAKQYEGMPLEQKQKLLVMNSQLIGVLAVAAQGKSDSESLQTGARVAATATQYNYLLHEEILERNDKVKACGSNEACQQQTLRYYADLDTARNASLPGLCESNPDQCMGLMRQLASERGLNAAAMEKLRFEDVNAAIGIQLASESNEAAIDTIQLELIRQRYGEGTAVALEVLQVAAAGGLGKRLISALGRLGKGGGQQATGVELNGAGSQGESSGLVSGPKATDSASNIALFERQRAGYAAQEIKDAQPVGSALKEDPLHRAPSYVIDQIPEKGRLFTIRGGDGKSYNLTQMEGAVDGKSGIFEWLVNAKGELTHQRFIPAGKITGMPNQIPSRLPR